MKNKYFIKLEANSFIGSIWLHNYDHQRHQIEFKLTLSPLIEPPELAYEKIWFSATKRTGKLAAPSKARKVQVQVEGFARLMKYFLEKGSPERR